MFRLAHISDPHLAGWKSPGPGSLLSKRFVGYLSWRMRRVGVHLTPILDRTVAAMKAASPDHIVVTGDIVNIALPDEFARATRWLETIGSPHDVTVIPGNHDAYIEVPWSDTIGQWARYMGDDGQLCDRPDSFPFVRVRDGVALVGLSSACPMPIVSAGGKLGTAQLDRLRTRLAELGQQGLFRILLIHHPPFGDPRHRRKELVDATDLQAVVAQSGVELVLHGHTHISSLNRIAVPDGTAPVIGVASASARAWKTKDAARFHLYEIERRDGGWQVHVEVRTLTDARDDFERTSAFRLAVPMTDFQSRPEAA